MKITAAFLADAAAVLNGKLYVHGGGWDRISAAAFPTTHPSMALALVFMVDYGEALIDHPIRIELLDEDEHDVGLRGEGALNVGHPAGMKVGTPLFVPQAWTFNFLQFPKPGLYHFRISTREEELASVPFQITSLPLTSPGLRLPGS